MRTEMRVLVVEDEAKLAQVLARGLREEGYAVDVTGRGEDALWMAKANPYDAILLDVMLPGADGFEVCRQIRADPALGAVPVIMLTARGDEADRLAGLELGAEDYVTKPFSPKELVARVAARLRRQAGAVTTGVVQYGAIAIDADRHIVTLAGAEVKLTAKEFLLLQYLIQHRGRVLSRDVLLTDVWGYQYTGGTRTVDVHIRRLREKLPVLNQAIETVKQFGYKLT